MSLAGHTVTSWSSPDRLELRSVASAVLDLEEQTEGPLVRDEYAFPGLLDRDIYMFAVEAYGYASVHRPDIAEQVEPYRTRLYEALRRRGYDVRSSYLVSPVAGGYSWLAEATLLTGQWINSQERFQRLYGADIAALPRMLYDGGYHTLTVRPGTVHGSWPEAFDLYGFADTIVAYDGDFNYVGPWFSYVPVTDQFAVWTGHKRIRELTAAGGQAEHAPLFAYYQLVSSHTPFNRIPPIIEEWEDLGNGDIYHERADEITTFDNSWTGGSELIEGYVAAIGYVFDVLAKYVEEELDTSRNPIIIVFGDHQPQRPIRAPDAHLSVPIHVASRDPEVLAQFAARGYQRGMVSSQAPPHSPMDSFLPMFASLSQVPAGVVEQLTR
jgi:hypothetical protein